MNALRNLGMTNTEFGRTVSRLSTGLRINSAADDPAGLIISESFRAQIVGLDQAIRNNQDAINYAKTAEGALDEVNKLLREARALAIASANAAALTDSQQQANQAQLNSIISSINRIASDTQFGTKRILDGSAGVNAVSTSGANVAGMSFSGVFNGRAVTGSSAVTVQVTTAATKAAVAANRTFATATTTMTNAGSFTINGVSFTVSTTDTIQDVVARIQNASHQTGVTASWAAGGAVALTSVGFGTEAKVQLVDTNAVILNAAGASSAAGTNAVATVTIDPDGSGSGAAETVTFDKGQGLVLRDASGNSIALTEAGNLTTAAAAMGQIFTGSSTFQIGANAHQTTSLSLRNMAASELGRDVVASSNLSNASLLTQADATDAIRIIDKAIEDTTVARGDIGNFIRNVLESNTRSLGIARENLSATESGIRDIDVAAEMTSFTRLQILQQSGLAVLAQANAAPQSVLALLRQ
jgi:flagellin